MINEEVNALRELNRRLEECVRLFGQFKHFVGIHSDKLNLKPNERQYYDQLVNDIDNSVKNLESAEENGNDNQMTTSGIEEEVDLTLDDSNDEPTHESDESLHLESDYNFGLNPNGLDKAKVTDPIEDNFAICSFCQKKFTSDNEFFAHMKTHLMNHLPNDGTDFVCDHEGCDFRSGDHHLFVEHWNQHKMPMKKINDKSLNELRVCDICDKEFLTKRNLQIHKDSVHDKSKTLVCELDDCQKQFTSERAFKRHQNVCHILEKKYVCHQNGCQYRTAIRQVFKNHQLLIHSGADSKTIACDWPQCNYKTNMKNSLKLHMRVHSSECNFVCDVPDCGLRFKSKLGLASHKKNNSHKTKIVHSCEWPGCDYQSTAAYKLSEHMRVHSTEHNIVCYWPECGKRFKTETILDNHMKIHTEH